MGSARASSNLVGVVFALLKGSVSEWLRRQIRNLLGSAASSNLVASVFFFGSEKKLFKAKILREIEPNNFFGLFSKNSKAGNRTRVSCVTGRNTNHYTTSDQLSSRGA